MTQLDPVDSPEVRRPEWHTNNAEQVSAEAVAPIKSDEPQTAVSLDDTAPTPRPSTTRRNVVIGAGLTLLTAAAAYGLTQGGTDKPSEAVSTASPDQETEDTEINDTTLPSNPTETTITVEDPTATETAPEVTATAEIVLPGGFEVNLDYISNEDIETGRAVETIKQLAGLYITTGDASIFEGFVDTTQATEWVSSLQRIRDELGFEEYNRTFPNTNFRFDTRDMTVEPVSVGPDGARYLVTGGRDPYIDSETPDGNWNNFDFNDESGRVTVTNPGPQQVYADFILVDQTWLFIGFRDL